MCYLSQMSIDPFCESPFLHWLLLIWEQKEISLIKHHWILSDLHGGRVKFPTDNKCILLLPEITLYFIETVNFASKYS